MKKLAIIGASYLQEPLIEKAKELGFETHVFAWEANDMGEKSADVFYPISIVEKERILERCRAIGICGVCSIASDLAAVTVNYVAQALDLPGNSLACTVCSTNKHAMREAFARGGDPSPRSLLVEASADGEALLHGFSYPVIVKPTDRSGSRGITRLDSANPDALRAAVEAAQQQSFEHKALVEEFAPGREYSVECASQGGVHHFIALTQKYTTGAPHFIETAHLQPAQVDAAVRERVRRVVFHALDTLGITDSVSHSEVKIAPDGCVRIVEIGGRMGGDCIGSDLVRLSTGVDFVRVCIDLAVGNPVTLTPWRQPKAAAVRFVLRQEDLDVLTRLRARQPETLVLASKMAPFTHTVVDSATRFGYYLMQAGRAEDLACWLPTPDEEKKHET